MPVIAYVMPVIVTRDFHKSLVDSVQRHYYRLFFRCCFLFFYFFFFSQSECAVLGDPVFTRSGRSALFGFDHVGGCVFRPLFYNTLPTPIAPLSFGWHVFLSGHFLLPRFGVLMIFRRFFVAQIWRINNLYHYNCFKSLKAFIFH